MGRRVGVAICECKTSAEEFWENESSDEYGGEDRDDEGVRGGVCRRCCTGSGIAGPLTAVFLVSSESCHGRHTVRDGRRDVTVSFSAPYNTISSQDKHISRRSKHRITPYRTGIILMYSKETHSKDPSHAL